MSDEPATTEIGPESAETTPATADAGVSSEPMIGATATDEVKVPDEDDLAERLRAALLATDDDLDPDTLSGDTFDEVVASFAAARAPQDPTPEPAPPVPAGAPGRLAPLRLTAFEKIREGLARR